MKVIVKTLKAQRFTFELSPQATIFDLKQKIMEVKKIAPESQKLVYKGNETQNDHLISSYNIDDNSHLILMTIIKKPELKRNEETKINISGSSKPQCGIFNKVENESIKKKIEKLSKKDKKEKNMAKDEFEKKVSSLMEMGFDRSKCVAALKATDNNDTGLAADHLLFKIYQKNNEQATGLEQSQAYIRQLIQKKQNIRQLVQLIRKDPTAKEPVLSQIKESLPKLYNLIRQKPQVFQKIIEQDEISPQVRVIYQKDKPKLLPEDRDAIKRLRDLGFKKKDAIEAFLVCDKNESLAASFLYNQLEQGYIISALEQQKKEEDSPNKKDEEQE